MNYYPQPEQLELPNIINSRLENWELKIYYDRDSESPREWCNIGQFLVKPNSYINNELQLSSEYECVLKYGTRTEIEKLLDALGYIYQPVTIYSHSGVRIYLGEPCCRWDSAIVGYYVIHKDELKTQFNSKRISKKQIKRAFEIMDSEVETFSNWVEGNVYQFQLYKNGEFVDSCSGFIAESEDDAVKQMVDSGCLCPEFTESFTMEEIVNMAETILD